ncbi:hypothetical protein ASG17_07790 [Brevundimonas sp. Leaf363]|nr:hypothetical protein ASG17_07790 [Brevundimonas sp. Leaf363]
MTVIEGDRLKIATLNDTGFRGDFVNRFTFVSRPQPEPGAEGVEAAVERKAFDPQFYAELREHALTALRDRKPFTINADGALAIIDQAAADRASHEAQAAEIKALKEGLELVAGLLPSLAGADGQPDGKVYAIYATKREIMAAKEIASTLTERGQ